MAEYYLTWCKHLFNAHGRHLKDNSSAVMTLLRTLQKNVTMQQQALSKLADENRFSMRYLRSVLDKGDQSTLGGIESTAGVV